MGQTTTSFFHKTIDFFIIVWYNIYVNKREPITLINKTEKEENNMKNIYGLANAMKVVESACEKGEITIIGEGATPSAVALYDKCVAYINKMYGVDILNLVVKKAAEPAPKVEVKCCLCEVEEKVISVNLVKLKEGLVALVDGKFFFLPCSVKEDIVNEILERYDTLNGESIEEYDHDCASDAVYDALCDAYDNACDLEEDYVGEFCKCVVKLAENYMSEV